MLTKIKNFVKKAFKKVKEVIMGTVETVIDIAKEVADNPEAKPFISFAAPKAIIASGLVAVLTLAVCYVYYHFNEESIDNAYYANKIRKIKARQEYLKAIDIL